MPRKIETYDGKILLIRPDRYVAAAFAPQDAATVAETLTAQVGVQVGAQVEAQIGAQIDAGAGIGTHPEGR